MYLSYFHLKENPFKISTDPQYLWLGEKHKEALSALHYGILDNKGFLLLTGDVGTGKTTLINALLERLKDDVIVAVISDPGLQAMDLYNHIAHAFKINHTFSSKGTFLLHFRDFLQNIFDSGKKCLLIIDEAQRLNNRLLEEIRLLSNIEKETTKLINIFFVGQNEFIHDLLKKENRALKQRITVNFHLKPLKADEIAQYIQYRLSVTGSSHKIFTDEAIAEIYKFSKGYPRVINIICDHAMLTAYVKEKKSIGWTIILECAQELSIDLIENATDEKDMTSTRETHKNTKAKGVDDNRPEPGRNFQQASEQDTTVFENRSFFRPILINSIFFLFAALIAFIVYDAIFTGKYSDKYPFWKWIKAAAYNTESIDMKSPQMPDRNRHTTRRKIEKKYVKIHEVEDLRLNNDAKETGDKIQVSRIEENHTMPAEEDKERPLAVIKGATVEAKERMPVKENNLATVDRNAHLPTVNSSTEFIGTHRPLGEGKKDLSPESNNRTAVEMNDKVAVIENSREYTEGDKREMEEKYKTKESETSIQHFTLPKMTIYFDYDSREIKNKSREKLDKVANILVENRDFNMVLTGYTDSKGNYEYNKYLSEQRAVVVKNYLVMKGIDFSRIKTVGKGPKLVQDTDGKNAIRSSQEYRRVDIQFHK